MEKTTSHPNLRSHELMSEFENRLEGCGMGVAFARTESSSQPEAKLLVNSYSSFKTQFKSLHTGNPSTPLGSLLPLPQSRKCQCLTLPAPDWEPQYHPAEVRVHGRSRSLLNLADQKKAASTHQHTQNGTWSHIGLGAVSTGPGSDNLGVDPHPSREGA